jgi:hypothetical protein
LRKRSRRKRKSPQLAERAGHRLDLTRIAGQRWIEASIASRAADYRPMAEVIAAALPRAADGR